MQEQEVVSGIEIDLQENEHEYEDKLNDGEETEMIEASNKLQHPIVRFFSTKPQVRKLVLLILFVGFMFYTLAAFVYDYKTALPLLYIELVLGSFVILPKMYRLIRAKLMPETNESDSESESEADVQIDAEEKSVYEAEAEAKLKKKEKRVKLFYGGALFLMLLLGFIFSRNDLSQLFGFIGATAIVLMCYIFSWNRQAVNWRPVFWGFSLQFAFGVIILKTKAGENVFDFFGDQIAALQTYTNVGVEFVFSPLDVGTPFALNVLPVIIIYSGISKVLFHWGILQKITEFIGGIMIYTMGTSPPESLNAAGNIFLGQTESPLLIKPYLKDMTDSEIHAVMTGGFATVAGGVLAAFILAGVPAEHLLSASVMSAPAALAISKIVFPETEKKEVKKDAKPLEMEKCSNALEAFSVGASESIPLIANIIANLIAFLALISFLNEVVTYLLLKVGVEDINFEQLVGYMFAPFAFLMGVPLDQCGLAGELLGIKTVTNEFVAFTALENSELERDSRTYLTMTYALCGFANFSSIGIQIGALSAMEKEKSSTFASLAFSAMVCGNLACFMTACIASVLLA